MSGPTVRPARDTGPDRPAAPLPGACWLSTARYSRPLDDTQGAKWRLLRGLDAPLFVIGFSNGWRPRRFFEGAMFYLVPAPPVRALRAALYAVLAPCIAAWVVLVHGVPVLIAQGPYEGALAASVKSLAGWLGRRVALILESHGDFVEAPSLYRARQGRSRFRWVTRALTNRAIGAADIGRVVSDATRRQIARWRPDLPLEQFPTWTDASVFLGQARLRPLAQCRNVLFVGLLAPVKGIETLLHAFAIVAGEQPQARLVLVGSRAGPTARAFERLIQELSLAGRVDLIGYVPQAEVARQMSVARVLVLPSLSEGLPRVLLEAQACGTPVIGSAVGGIPESLLDGETGFLVPPGDAPALAAAIGRMLSGQEIESMGARARQFAAGRLFIGRAP